MSLEVFGSRYGTGAVIFAMSHRVIITDKKLAVVLGTFIISLWVPIVQIFSDKITLPEFHLAILDASGMELISDLALMKSYSICIIYTYMTPFNQYVADDHIRNRSPQKPRFQEENKQPRISGSFYFPPVLWFRTKAI